MLTLARAVRNLGDPWECTMLGQMGHLVCGYSLLRRVSDMPRPLVKKFIYQIWKENEYKIIQQELFKDMVFSTTLKWRQRNYLPLTCHATSIIGPQASAVGQILGDGKRPNEKEWDSLASQVAAATSFYLWPLLIIDSKCPLCKALLSWAPDFSKVMSTSPSFLIGSYFQ